MFQLNNFKIVIFDRVAEITILTYIASIKLRLSSNNKSSSNNDNDNNNNDIQIIVVNKLALLAILIAWPKSLY